MSKHSLSSGKVGQSAHGPAIERAALALRMSQFSEAEQLATDILKSSRTDSAAISILAHALLAQNRGDEAIAPLEKAVRRGGDAAISTLLGAALGSAGRRMEAIEHLRLTIARHPPFAPAFQELAGQLAKGGHLDEAVDAIENGIAVMPTIVALQLDLARLHLQRNDRGKARAVLLQARDVAPVRDVMTALARVLLLDGDYAAAADCFRHALAMHPDDALTRADLAACLLEMGQREAGEASLRLAARGRPQMFGRMVYALAMSSHGRFFFRPSGAAKFLNEKPS